jgi:tetratricopeptide (TPR) repeat protein
MDDAITVAIPEGALPGWPPTAGPPALGCGDMLGRYVILEALGRGGMGIVYAAYDPQLERRVALKVIRPDSADRMGGRARLVREARALAQLAHPNVVAIYDVDTVAGQVVLAMELVEGLTLSEWLEGKRTWREILDVFVLAGRGLAAAHAADIVHRDFKPANVLVALLEPPIVRVLDFGLAQPAPTLPSDPDATPEPVAPLDALAWSGGSSERMTAVGCAVGTPRYMSPEQRMGLRVDARSDQFSFCVALWEALYGASPGPVADDERASESRSRPKLAPRVPAFVRVVLRRGLAPDPARRFDTMHALLEALDRDRSRRGRWWMASAAALAIGGAAIGSWSWHAAQAAACSSGASHWEGVWSPARRDAAAQAFAGAHAWEHVERTLDDYGEAWIDRHREACEDVRRDGDEARLDRRMSCLQRALGAADALVELLETADAPVVRNAVLAVDGLPAPDACGEPAGPQLLASSDPAARELVAELAHVEALLAAGRYADALPRANALEAGARGLDDGPLLAEVLLASGRAAFYAERHEHALARLQEAAFVAGAHGHDRVVPVAINEIVYLLGYKLGRHDEALAWGKHGLAAAERLADPAGPRGRLLVSIGNALEGKAQYEAARDHYTEALELLRASYGPESPYVARALNSLGNAQYLLADVDAAGETYARSHAIWSAALGEDHPDAVIPLTNWGRIHMRNGRLEQGKQMTERVLDVWSRVHGPEHSLLTIPLSSLAEVDRDLGLWDEALGYDERALAIYDKTLGPGHPNSAYPLYGIGMSHYRKGRWEQARDAFARALAIREKANGPNDPRLCLTLGKLALTAVELGDGETALAYAERALAIGEKAYGPESPNVARYHHTLAEVLVGIGRRTDAVPHLLRTIALRPGPTKYHPDELGAPLFELARAYLELGHDRNEVLALAEAGALRYDAWNLPARAAEIRAWSADVRGRTRGRTARR